MKRRQPRRRFQGGSEEGPPGRARRSGGRAVISKTTRSDIKPMTQKELLAELLSWQRRARQSEAAQAADRVLRLVAADLLSLSFDVAAASALRRGAQFLGMESAYLMLYGSDGRLQSLLWPESRLAEGGELEGLPPGLRAYALARVQSGKAVSQPRADMDQRIGAAMPIAALRTFRWQPVRGGAPPMGLLGFHSSARDVPWSASRLAFADGLADLLGRAHALRARVDTSPSTEL